MLPKLDRNTGEVFSISFETYRNEKKQNLSTLIIKMLILFACRRDADSSC